MPSESSFKKQSELVREALKTFTTVRSLKAPGIVRSALFDLIDTTLELHPFVPFFGAHELLHELPSAVYNALNDFASDNPSFLMPKSMDRLVLLKNRVQDSSSFNKGMILCFFCIFPLFTFFLKVLSRLLLPKPISKVKSLRLLRFVLFSLFLRFIHPYFI